MFQFQGKLIQIGHIERFNPALQEMRRRIDAGDLGEVYQVITRRQGPFPARIADVGGTHLILRTSWVYGLHGKNFLLTMLKLAETRADLSVVDDQVGAVAHRVLETGDDERAGVHAAILPRREHARSAARLQDEVSRPAGRSGPARR